MENNNLGIHVNTFEGGLNRDVSPKFIKQNQYIQGVNVTLRAEGEHFTLSPILKDSLINIIAEEQSYDNIYQDLMVLGHCVIDNGSEESGVIVFYNYRIDEDDEVFKIKYLPSKGEGAPISILSESFNGKELYNSFVDSLYFSESGESYIYFTCKPLGIYKFKLTSTGSPQSSLEQMKMTPSGVNAFLYNPVIGSNGSVLTGSYRFCIQLYNSELNKSSKWSIPSQIVHITNGASSTFDNEGSQLLQTYKSIQLTGSLPFDIFEEYNKYRLAVIKETDGSGVPTSTAILTNYFDINDFNSTFAINGVLCKNGTIEYTGNEDYLSTTIEEIVVDDAPIESFESILVKNNILVGGGVKYKELAFDNGNPSLTGCSVAYQNIGVPHWSAGISGYGYSSESNASKYKGHFRNEVYRYYISYFDEDFSFGEPIVLDFKNLTGNAAAADCIDFKFPNRNTTGGALFASGSNNLRALGLNINGIKNHPSWAKGFVILRAKRKRKIEFQTPMIPTYHVYPALSVGDYPLDGETIADTSGAIFPMSLATQVPRNIVRRATVQNDRKVGECFYEYHTEGDTFCVFIPEALYNNTLQPFSDREPIISSEVNIIDIAYPARKGDSTYTLDDEAGLSVEDNASVSFNAEFRSDYYSNGTRTNPSVYQESVKVKGFAAIPNGNQDGFQLPFTNYAGISKFNDYNSIQGSVKEGSVGLSHKMGVIKVSKKIPHIQFLADYGSTIIPSPFDEEIYGPKVVDRNDELYTLQTNQNEFTPVATGCVVSIVNIENGSNDFRYGEASSYHELYYTGAFRYLTSTEITNNTPVDIQVFGGDCFIGSHRFKIASNINVIVDVEITTNPGGSYVTDSTAKWGTYYSNGNALNIARPINVAGFGQYLEVFLESEVNPQMANRELWKTDGNGNNTPAEFNQIFFEYRYNPSYSMENNAKVFFPLDTNRKRVNEYPARIHYSDTKTYQTSLDQFSKFRALNFYDLDEQHGAITKLYSNKENLYSFQTNTVMYIPFQSSQIETADAGTLSVRNQEVIGKPIKISNNAGTFYPLSIVSNNDVIFYFDTVQGKYNVVNGQNIQSLSDIGIKKDIENISERGITNKSSIKSFYDFKNAEVGVLGSYPVTDYNEPFLFVYSDLFKCWVSEYIFTDDSEPASLFYAFNDTFALLSDRTNSIKTISANKMYSGDTVTNISFVEFIVNPDVIIPKTFDSVNINISDKPEFISIVTNQERSGGAQYLYSEQVVDFDIKEMTWRIKNLRSTNILNPLQNQRLRGLYSSVVLNFSDQNQLSADRQQKLFSVITKYRPSNKAL
jgi:hypothetical protein